MSAPSSSGSPKPSRLSQFRSAVRRSSSLLSVTRSRTPANDNESDTASIKSNNGGSSSNKDPSGASTSGASGSGEQPPQRRRVRQSQPRQEAQAHPPPQYAGASFFFLFSSSVLCTYISFFHFHSILPHLLLIY